MKWILFWFVAGCLVCSLGCAHSQRIKVITDIAADGEITYHTEYIAEF